MPPFPFSEKHLSQLPALQQLINLGYQYLSPAQAMTERGGRASNVLLENILRDQLKKINRIRYKGGEYLFSEENIQSAIQKLKTVQYDGLQKTNEAIYDLITLGTALEQTIEGDSKSFTLNYIDWKNPANNAFHAVAEFSVERARSTETARPDIVLFVNGIPLVVIECKAPDTDAEQAVSQMIRNQGEEYIPRLFTYAQVLLAVNKNEAKYATVGTSKEFWSVWDELEDTERDVNACINKALSSGDKDALFSGEFASARSHFDALERSGDRLVTEQDRCLYSLCRPERLLELIFGFIVFDVGSKKIARYQQFFLVRTAMKRVKQKDNEGRRTGGIVWHTQGSGKSITMVMLARALSLDPDLTSPRMILVTDRKDLDKQLGNTFAACGLDKERATSGRNLIRHIKNRVGIITTLINKFDKALSAEKYVDDSADIIVLVDESHRTNFGSLAARMRQMLPNACYIGFTGTPLLKEEKNSFARFGGLIEPHYSVRRAIEDKAVVPLLYEGRHVEMEQNQAAIDLWFARHTEDLADEQKADLKRKYARARELSKTDQVVYMCAFDISRHFQTSWQNTGFKAQLVVDSKTTALKYRESLNGIGAVSSEVVISPPDTREGHEEVGAETTSEVSKFWNKMMARYGSEDQYNKQIIAQFKHSDRPEILIVVDKLITGFDAPRNTVLYLCRKLREHTLLQAIARVNRLHEGKEFGYIIDYANVLGELDKALHTYDALAGFDGEDLADFLTSIHEEMSNMVKEERGVYQAKTTAARADIIAHAAKRTITENMDKDPAFYEKFSKLIQDAIDGFRNQRISDLEYLQKVSAIRDEVANTQRDDVPDSIRDNEEASAYFGAIKSCLTEVGESRVDYVAAETALAVKSALEKNWKVDFWNDSDAQNAAKNEMDDFFYDVVKDGHGIDLSSAQMDEMISQTMKIAKSWRHSYGNL